jgi:hypothetical protein
LKKQNKTVETNNNDFNHFLASKHANKNITRTGDLDLYLQDKPVGMGQTKHLGSKMKWLRDLYHNNGISVKLIPSEDMIADTLTKSSSSNSLKRLNEHCFLVEVLFSSNCGMC